MAQIIIQTDDGHEVDRIVDIHAADVRGLAETRSGRTVVPHVRRAVEDADVIEAGGDPERPSEKAMRLASLTNGKD